MSLINDALKRARQAQRQNQATPPPALALRPAEHTEPASLRSWLVPVVVGLAAFALLFLLWRNLASSPIPGDQNAGVTSELVVQAKPLPPAPPAPVAAPPAVVAPEPAVAPESLPDMSVPADPPPAARPETEVIPATSVPVAPALREPAPLRLQAIVFNPARPSALISGKTVFLGNQINGLSVTAITRNTAVLVGGGQTNVLSLPE